MSYGYIESPADVQRALQILLWLFEQEDKPRPVYGRAIKRACRLLAISYDPKSDRWVRWGYWQRRMRAAGLDERDPFVVIDEERWNAAWEQLVETETFTEEHVQRVVASGRPPPKAEERYRAVNTENRKKKVRTEPIANYLPRELRKKLGKRS